MDAKPSVSEDNGIAALDSSDLKVYSVGISTDGAAEMRMAKALPTRHIIATTVDEEGVEYAKKCIKQEGLEEQIMVKLEDVSKPLPYADGHFDFIYARLVLHYLSKQALDKALTELRRVLKPNGRMFVVVRSTESDDAKAPDGTFDPETNLTTRIKVKEQTGRTYAMARYYHTEKSISDHLSKAGFKVDYTKAYPEQLYRDFMRTRISDNFDHMVELMARK